MMVCRQEDSNWYEYDTLASLRANALCSLSSSVVKGTGTACVARFQQAQVATSAEPLFACCMGHTPHRLASSIGADDQRKRLVEGDGVVVVRAKRAYALDEDLQGSTKEPAVRGRI